MGSVELSDNAIIFINKESLDLIPEEEKEKWKIVVCNEDISQAVKHFFKKNNIPQIPYEDHPGHQMNEEYNLESNLQSRDKAINYVKDNKFDGKSDIQFTMQEFLDIMRIFQDSQNRMPISTKISLVEIINASNNQQGYSLFSNTNYGDIPSKVIDIIMSCGFYLTEEGSIKLKDDEEIYNFLVNPKSLAEKTISESKELYMKYVEFLYSKPQSELLDFENEIIERTLQDIKEKNYEELSENEKRIIDRILNVRESDLSQLSEDEITIIKNMKPKCYNEINDKCSIQVIYSDDGTVYVYVYGNTVDDYTELSNKFQNINGIKLNEILEDCELRIDGQQENETFGEFYSRVQGVIDAFAEILTSDEDLSECFKFSSSGVLDKRKHDKVNALLSSAIETTCEVTRTGKINEQIMKIHECQRDKDKSPFEINQ